MIGDNRQLLGIDYSTASADLIELILSESAPPSLYEEIARANVHRPEILAVLIDNREVPDAIRRFIAGLSNVPVQVQSMPPQAPHASPQRSQTILQKVQRLSVSERIHLALRGGKEVRAILLRDQNKEVSLTVLDNPRITETEVEMVAKSRSVSDEALRKISKKKEWMKNYQIVHALVTNPKTPAALALSLVSELKTRDLGLLAKNRNVSEGVRSAAKKILRSRQAH